MQGASYFSRANQHARITQFEELAKHWQNKLPSHYPIIWMTSSKDNVNPHIIANLNHLTHDSRVLDAKSLLARWHKIAHSGENVTVKSDWLRKDKKWRFF